VSLQLPIDAAVLRKHTVWRRAVTRKLGSIFRAAYRLGSNSEE
jgi:hypothetical protein